MLALLFIHPLNLVAGNCFSLKRVSPLGYSDSPLDLSIKIELSQQENSANIIAGIHQHCTCTKTDTHDFRTIPTSYANALHSIIIKEVILDRREKYVDIKLAIQSGNATVSSTERLSIDNAVSRRWNDTLFVRTAVSLIEKSD